MLDKIPAHFLLAVSILLPVSAALGQDPAPSVPSANEYAAEGWAAFESNNLSRAEELLIKAVRLDPRQPDYHAALGIVYLRVRENEKAVAQLQEAVRQSPSNAEFRLELAEAYQAGDRDLDALKDLDGKEPEGGLQKRWIFSRGFSLFRAGRFPEARRQYERLLEDPAMAAPSNFFLGNICFAQNRFPDAARYYAEAIRLGDQPGNRPFNAYTYNYGLALYHLGRFADAAAAFQLSIDRFQNDPLPWLWLGRCKQELGSYREAIDDLEESVRINPDFRLSYFQLARLQFQFGDKKRAAELFAKVNQLKRTELDTDERKAGQAKIPGDTGTPQPVQRQ
jgi:tetratricopeptide (TPR) repeat protein